MNILHQTVVVFAFAALAVLGSCVGGTTSGTETGSRISIRGRVVDGDKEPVAGLVARLSLSGIADTTDSQGRYHILGEGGSATAETGVLDTLIVSQAGQRVAALGITKWVDSLPDIKVVQRSFSGRIDAAGSEVGRVEGVLSGSGLPEGNRVVAEFFYNKPVREYSGFIYFPVSGTEATYLIYVNLYDSAGLLTGRSDTIAFNSLAGDITLPEFHAGNVRFSALAGADTVVARGGKVVLSGRAFTPPGTQVTEFGWKIGDGTDFATSPDGRIEFTAPIAEDSAFPAILRVRNGAGAIAFDTLQVRTATLFDSLLERPWRLATGQPAYPHMDWSTAVVFKDRIRLLGRGGDYFQSWESMDGRIWKGVACMGICPEGRLAIAVHGEKIWAMADANPDESFNRIWSSADGVDWIPGSVPPDLGARSEMKVASFLGRLWVIGGMIDGKSQDQVWSSAEGTHWELAASKAGFDFPVSAFVQGGRMWVIGQDQVSITGEYRRTLWSTADGKKWEQAGISGGFPKGYVAFSAVEFQGRILFLGGMYLNAGNGLTDQREALYMDRDGCCLKTVSASSSPPSRAYGTAVVYKGSVYQLGGLAYEKSVDEVWYWGME